MTKYFLEVKTTPVVKGSSVTINGISTKTLYVEEQTNVEITVAAPGYLKGEYEFFMPSRPSCLIYELELDEQGVETDVHYSDGVLLANGEPISIDAEKNGITGLSPSDVLPSMAGQDGKYLVTDGTTAVWADVTENTFIHTQSESAMLWSITHNLGKFPSITVVDENNEVVECEKVYIDENNVELSFNSAFRGKAYLN